jgi:hypothetical protein
VNIEVDLWDGQTICQLHSFVNSFFGGRKAPPRKGTVGHVDQGRCQAPILPDASGLRSGSLFYVALLSALLIYDLTIFLGCSRSKMV